MKQRTLMQAITDQFKEMGWEAHIREDFYARGAEAINPDKTVLFVAIEAGPLDISEKYDKRAVSFRFEYIPDSVIFRELGLRQSNLVKDEVFERMCLTKILDIAQICNPIDTEEWVPCVNHKLEKSGENVYWKLGEGLVAIEQTSTGD